MKVYKGAIEGTHARRRKQTSGPFQEQRPAMKVTSMRLWGGDPDPRGNGNERFLSNLELYLALLGLP